LTPNTIIIIIIMTTTTNLESLIYTNETGTTPKLSVLDQLLLPHQKTYLDIPHVEMAWTIIRTMQIRGAPLIAIVALLGLAVDLYTHPNTLEQLEEICSAEGEEEEDSTTTQKLVAVIQGKMEYLKHSRPTAVNLSNALQEVQTAMTEALSKLEDGNTKNDPHTVLNVLRQEVLKYAEFMLQRDVSDNRAIGQNGAHAIIAHKKGQCNKDDDTTTTKEKIHMVTICNTGSLATAGYGTALGVARALQEQDQLGSITALETRPYNQGSRLTAFEIMQEQMPGGRLICDSAAGALMQVRYITVSGMYLLSRFMTWLDQPN
jgi:eIF-2B alpha/beta/delta-like uncharacterized protein